MTKQGSRGLQTTPGGRSGDDKGLARLIFEAFRGPPVSTKPLHRALPSEATAREASARQGVESIMSRRRSGACPGLQHPCPLLYAGAAADQEPYP